MHQLRCMCCFVVVVVFILFFQMLRVTRVFFSSTSLVCWNISCILPGTCGAAVVQNKPSRRFSGLQEVVVLSRKGVGVTTVPFVLPIGIFMLLHRLRIQSAKAVQIMCKNTCNIHMYNDVIPCTCHNVVIHV